jgi:putative oxidoreductase
MKRAKFSNNTDILYEKIIMEQSTINRTNWALLITRVVVGVVFAAHGGQKLFQFGITGIEGGFQAMGIPLPEISAPVVTLVEFLGGIALAAGAFARVASLLLAIDMLGAMMLVHISNGFFLPQGFEYTLVLMAISVGFVITGAGAYSIDAIRQPKRVRQPVAQQVRPV